MRLDTLRARVVTWYVGLLAAALVVFSAAVYFSVHGYLVKSLQRALLSEASAIGTKFVAFEEQKGPKWMAGEISEAYSPELSGRYIRITRADGTVLYQSGDTRYPVIDASEVPHLHVEGDRRSYSEAEAGSSTVLLCTLPFQAPSGTNYVIETGMSTIQIQRVLATLLHILIFITPLIIIVAALGGQTLMKLPLQPLVLLAERAEHIGASKLGERLPVLSTGDEMERLALSLNRMIARLEDSLSLNRRFSADVSHELRTPLTIMRGELEQVLLDMDLEISARDAVVSVLEEIGRMAKIVESLLAIARLDSGADAIDLQPADVSELCRWTMEQMRLLADEKGIAMRIQTVPLTVQLDRARMKQVLVNLIDNAIKYTPDGGEIELDSFFSGKMAVIEISDTGIGISSSALPNVFDRFFRADKARSRVSGGTGLGLSIVKAICNAHGGSIAIGSKEGEGTVVRIELPIIGTVVGSAAITTLGASEMPVA